MCCDVYSIVSYPFALVPRQAEYIVYRVDSRPANAPLSTLPAFHPLHQHQCTTNVLYHYLPTQSRHQFYFTVMFIHSSDLAVETTDSLLTFVPWSVRHCSPALANSRLMCAFSATITSACRMRNSRILMYVSASEDDLRFLLLLAS